MGDHKHIFYSEHCDRCGRNAEAIIDDLEQQLRWRDVTEEPPEHLDRYYLAWGEDWGSPEKMHFNIHDGVQYWDGRNAELHYMGDSVIPTHWKPITPPEGE